MESACRKKLVPVFGVCTNKQCVTYCYYDYRLGGSECSRILRLPPKNTLPQQKRTLSRHACIKVLCLDKKVICLDTQDCELVKKYMKMRGPDLGRSSLLFETYLATESF
jgi:hypothetical protein